MAKSDIDLKIDTDDADERGGVKSIETGVRLLIALSEDVRPQMLKDLSARAKMHPAKAHRYIVSFLKSGLVGRDPLSGRYQLGPLALQIGVAAIDGLNVARLASPELSRLRDQTEATVALAVWGSHGTTHIVVEEASKPVVVKSRLGHALPTVNSASGRVFAAFLPSEVTKDLVDQELKALGKNAAALKSQREQFKKLLAEVRRQGMSRVLGDFSPGVHALSAPIFDYKGSIVAAITVLAAAGEFDTSFKGPVAQALRDATKRVSTILGLRE